MSEDDFDDLFDAMTVAGEPEPPEQPPPPQSDEPVAAVVPEAPAAASPPPRRPTGAQDAELWMTTAEPEAPASAHGPEGKIQYLRQKLKLAEQQLGLAREAWSQQKLTLEHTQAQLAEEQARAEAAAQKVNTLQKFLENKKGEVSSFVEKSKATVVQLQKELENAQRHRTLSDSELKARDAAIERAKVRIAELEKSLEASVSEMAQTSSAKQLLQRELDARDAAIERLKTLVTTKDTELSRLMMALRAAKSGST